jgi:hypothetical protein
MQVTVAHRTSRKAGEERTGTKWMGLEPTLDQTSIAVDTCFDDDDVAHTSPFKRYCDHTCTEALHTGKRCRACQCKINARAAPCFLGISICLKLPEVKIRRNSHCLLSSGLRHQCVLPLLTKLVEFQTENEYLRQSVSCSAVFTDISIPVVPLR